MTVIEPTPQPKKEEPGIFRTAVGVINTLCVLVAIVCTITSFNYLVFFDNPLKSIGFIVFGACFRYMFSIKRGKIM